MKPNQTSIAHRLLAIGIVSISDNAATKVAARLTGKRPAASRLVGAVKAASAAGEITITDVGGWTVIE